MIRRHPPLAVSFEDQSSVNIHLHPSDAHLKQPHLQNNESDNNERISASLPLKSNFSSDVIPILVIACNRPSVSRCLNELVGLRRLFHEKFPHVSKGRGAFPIYVSQDCGHKQTAEVIQSFVNEGHVQGFLKYPNVTQNRVPAKEQLFAGYFKLAQHYKWALDQMFLERTFSQLIIVEDDLDVGIDFLHYFYALAPILNEDPTLWCVSAWNDNGKEGLINITATNLLYRTDFFPGLGWMTKRSVWMEIRQNWPSAFWDDHLRLPAVRKGRQCIRPEISRTFTFGFFGVSNGQYYIQHLRFILLNNLTLANFMEGDMGYLLPQNYDRLWNELVYETSRLTTWLGVNRDTSSPASTPLRIEYQSNKELELMLRKFNAMNDLRSGVPRTAYRGVVPLMYRGKRVFIAPPKNSWKGYVDVK